MQVAPLTPDRYEEAAGILARAFFDDPGYAYVFNNPDQRLEQLRWLFRRLVSVLAPMNASYIGESGEGVACWIPPQYSPGPDLWAWLRAGLWKAPLKFGPGWTYRAIKEQRHIDQLHYEDLKEPHWILEILAVDPDHHKSGVGTALITPIIERAAREKIPCYVLTHKTANPGYYRRFGFQKVQEHPKTEKKLYICSLQIPVEHHDD